MADNEDEKWYYDGEGEPPESQPEPPKVEEAPVVVEDVPQYGAVGLIFRILLLGGSMLLTAFSLFFIAAVYLEFGRMPFLIALGPFALAGWWHLAPRDRLGKQLLNTLFVSFLLFLYAMVVAPNFIGHGMGTTTACKSNLKNIGTALEMYSTDNSGHYPRSMSFLTPNYLKTIPTCPAAGRNTYSEFYLQNETPDLYTVFCHGHHHKSASVSPNYPQFTAVQGLIER